MQSQRPNRGDWDAQTGQIIESFQSDIYRAALVKEQEERQAVEAQLSEAAQARRNAEMIAASREQEVLALKSSH